MLTACCPIIFHLRRPQRTRSTLSRRDSMNEARQFTAWKQLKKRSVPLGYGMIVVRRSGHARRMVTEATSNQIIPSLRDGLSFGVIPGNKLPGYVHKVPPGQKRFVPSWPTQSRDQETTSACVPPCSKSSATISSRPYKGCQALSQSVPSQDHC